MEWEPFAWVAWGVYIGLPPRGTMVIWPAAGPGCQCLQPPASPPTAGARRLVGPADWLVAAYCSRVVGDESLVTFAWLQSRRLAGGYCSHTWSHQLNGMHASGQGTAACWRPAPLESAWSSFRRLPGGHCPVGPASDRPHRQAVVGNRTPPARSDVRGDMAQCPAVRRSPSVRSTVAMLVLSIGGDAPYYSHAPSCTLNGGLGHAGRPPACYRPLWRAAARNRPPRAP